MLKKTIAPLFFGVMSFVVTLPAVAADMPFGSNADVKFANKLWKVMKHEKLVGPNSINSVPYFGGPPHGSYLETLDSVIKVNNLRSVVIVKKNYDDDITIQKNDVANKPAEYLDAITVMFYRPGYDPENHNWFYVKYNPDGSLQNNPAGIPLAGRIAKGMPSGCIACHVAAPGGDYVFNNNRFVTVDVKRRKHSDSDSD